MCDSFDVELTPILQRQAPGRFRGDGTGLGGWLSLRDTARHGDAPTAHAALATSSQSEDHILMIQNPHLG